MIKVNLMDLLKKLEEIGIKTVYDDSQCFSDKEVSNDYSNIERTKRNNMYFLVVYKGYNYGTGILTRDYESDILTFLKLNKFGCQAGYCGCPWYFVDIENRKYKPGRPGLSYGRVVGNHAITLNEFLLIYEIFNNHEEEPAFRREYDLETPLCFCIKHDNMADVDFYLDKEGFTSHLMSKRFTVENKDSKWSDYRFISIENKMFEPVLPGYMWQFRVVGLKVITFSEFITIYKIYKKYEGLESLTMEDGYDFREWRELI